MIHLHMLQSLFLTIKNNILILIILSAMIENSISIITLSMLITNINAMLYTIFIAALFCTLFDFSIICLFKKININRIVNNKIDLNKKYNYFLDKIINIIKHSKESGVLYKISKFTSKYRILFYIFYRFIPFLRFPAAFIISKHNNMKEIFIYNFIGAIIWVGLCISIGYFGAQLKYNFIINKLKMLYTNI